MDLPPEVLQNYLAHFRRVEAEQGRDLQDVLQHYGAMNDELWLLLNRIIDWRLRSDDPLHAADRMVIACLGLRSDVQNGGFSQYFTNESGDGWPEILDILVLGNDEPSERHFRRVLSAFPNSLPSVNWEQREAELGEIENRNANWDDPLNSEYYRGTHYPADETLFRALSRLEDPDFIPRPDADSPES